MPPLRRYIQLVRMLKFNKLYTHFAVELVLLIVVIFSVGTNLIVRADSNSAETQNRSLFFIYLSEHPGINDQLVDAYGSLKMKITDGPELTRQVLAASAKDKSLNGTADNTPLPTLSGSALLKPNLSTNDGTLGTQRDTQIYTVQAGDSVAKIAANYGLKQNTIFWENGLTAASLIKPGQELRILPGDGVKHTIKKGETLYEIALKYGVDIDIILDDNGIEIAEHIFPADEIYIRNGEIKPEPSPRRNQYLAQLQRTDLKQVEVNSSGAGASSILWPVTGCSQVSQSFWYRHRAIDIPCKYQSVRASAGGIVELSGWQGGYGYTIIINHQNGYKTRVAHLSRMDVSAGDKVGQGQTIGVSGNTGRSTGPHVHFEIIKNGALVNPLGIVSR